jgi:uncharacterized small protein (DUF1192 family)
MAKISENRRAAAQVPRLKERIRQLQAEVRKLRAEAAAHAGNKRSDKTSD